MCLIGCHISNSCCVILYKCDILSSGEMHRLGRIPVVFLKANVTGCMSYYKNEKVCLCRVLDCKNRVMWWALG